MSRKFYSEYGEDQWIAENVVLPAAGVYVDVGAAHPTQNSNTAFLRDMGWTGLAIDGDPIWTMHWPRTLPPSASGFEPSVQAAARTVKFHSNPNSWLSRIADNGVRCPARPLEDVLAQWGIEKIHFLSIDIEGAEWDVFQTMDLDRHRPDIIVAEYNTLDLGMDFRLRNFLLGTGRYRVAHQTVANLIYLGDWDEKQQVQRP